MRQQQGTQEEDMGHMHHSDHHHGKARTAAEDLREEHVIIERALSVLEAFALGVEASKAVPKERVASLLDLLKTFADKCHHGKEEQILFPALLATKAADARATVDDLLKEHEVGRAAVSRMSDGVAGWEKPEARRLFAAAAHDYVDLLRRHIAKETEGLLPLSERLLSQPEQLALAGKFEEMETQVIGHGVHERLLKTLEALERTV
jgi:hemerythrin-like domain-containing protein